MFENRDEKADGALKVVNIGRQQLKKCYICTKFTKSNLPKIFYPFNL